MTQSSLQPQSTRQRTLPAMLTISGPIFVGYANATVVPVAIEFMLMRELAWRTINPDYPARTSLGHRMAGDDAEAAYNAHAANLIGTFAVLSPMAQARFFAELLRYVEFHRDATGLEGILTTAIQSTWRSSAVPLSARGLQVWSKYAQRGQFAKRRGTFAYDELSRTVRAFLPGELELVSPDDAKLELIARAALRADPRLDPRIGLGFVPSGGRGIPGGDLNGPDGPSGPDYRGDRGSWGGGPRGSRGLDDFYDGFDDPDIDYRGSKSGWVGGPRRGGSGGQRDRSGLGRYYDGFEDSGPDYRGSPTSGSPDSPSRPGGQRDLLDSFDGPSLNDVGRDGSGIGALRPQSGPFSEAFRGTPSKSGQEVGSSWDDVTKGVGLALIAFGTVFIGTGALAATAAPATGGATAPMATFDLVGGLAIVVIGGALVSHADDDSAREREREKEVRDAEKAAKEKADKEKGTPVPDPKKKGESGLYPDPYGDGGGNPTTANLFLIPVDDSGGGGGVGPKWLNALPSEDGGGIVGPRFDHLPDSDGSGGGTPSSIYETSSIAVAGPGLKSFCIMTSGQTMLVLGMPKLANNRSVHDPGLLGALIR